MTVREFESNFLAAFKKEPGGMQPEVFDILDRLFADIDSYSPNCQQGQERPFKISEAALRQESKKALEGLRQFSLRSQKP